MDPIQEITSKIRTSSARHDGADASRKARGGNKSIIHIDWMIGSDRIDIDGLYADGRRVPVFRKGEWAV